MLDWPDKSLDLFIRCAHQNQGRLSNAKRSEPFDWMTQTEVSAAEQVILDVFGWSSD
jgi:hypothetical protein